MPLFLWMVTALAASSDAAALPPGLPSPVACGTVAFIGLEPAEPMPERPVDWRKSGKAERDAFGVTANELSTDNFVIRWGNRGGVTAAEVERLAEALEDSWLELVDLQGHSVPYGADEFKFNVYIGGSGDGTPSDGGAAGYFTTDSAGWPMVVVGAATLDDPDYADITAAHELYHAIQAGTGRYAYEGESAWFWEASAEWAAATVYPSNVYYAVFLFSYAFLPHYPVNFFDYPDRGELPEYYQYGAFIVPFHLSEITADRALIRDVWMAPSPASDPLSMIQRLMDDRGLSFDEAFVDHAARMVTYDYPEGRDYEYLVDYYAPYYSESSNTVAASVGPGGTDGLVAAPRSLVPYRYGYNGIRIDIGDATELSVQVEGDAEGSRGSAAQWGARLVTHSRETRAYQDVPFRGGSGTATLTGLDGETVWLVVAPWSTQDRYYDSETFSYQYSVTMSGAEDPDDPADPDDPGDTGGVADDSGDPDASGDDTAASDGEPSDDDTEVEAGGTGGGKSSGCAAVSSAALPVGLLGLVVVAGRRRRKAGQA